MRACYPYLAGLNTRPSLACLPAVQGATSLPIGLFPSGNQRCAMLLVPASLHTAGQLLPEKLRPIYRPASCQAEQCATCIGVALSDAAAAFSAEDCKGVKPQSG